MFNLSTRAMFCKKLDVEAAASSSASTSVPDSAQMHVPYFEYHHRLVSLSLFLSLHPPKSRASRRFTFLELRWRKISRSWTQSMQELDLCAHTYLHAFCSRRAKPLPPTRRKPTLSYLVGCARKEVLWPPGQVFGGGLVVKAPERWIA